MIKKVLFCAVILVTAAVLFSPTSFHFSSSPGGSPGGFSGSLGDNGKTCRNCHSGGGAPLKINILTTNIPSSGYVAGQTYDMSLTYGEAGCNIYGFEVTAENSANQRKGKFATNDGNTKTLNTSTRLTQTSAGRLGSGDARTWLFKWTAPAAGTGTITIYGSINAANGDGGNGGDKIYTFKETISEDVSSGVADYISDLNKLSVYPNPASDVITISGNNITVVEIYTLTGERVSTLNASNGKANVASLASGVYLLKTTGENTGITRFVKQ